MKAIVDKPWGLLALFAALAGVEAFLAFVMIERGLLAVLLETDVSFVSRVILGIYALASLHVLLVAHRLSVEARDLGRATAGGQVGRYFTLLARGDAPREGGDELLIEALDGRCRSQFRYGYVIADLMLKLGLLGTVVGFIFMLGSLVDLHSIDINVMQRLLAQMSGGMKIALFTTLTGMSCGVLLNMKYQLLDWRVDHLLDDVRELTWLAR